MGKHSVKENKTIYQLSREQAGLTRAQAAKVSDCFFTDSRIEKIESQKLEIHPEEVIKMSEIYHDSTLCAKFCATQCVVGKKRNFKVAKIQELSQIVLETLASLHYLNKEKERLIEITVDGKIDDTELEDFIKVQYQLNHISEVVDSLSVWVDTMIDNQELDRKKLEMLRKK